MSAFVGSRSRAKEGAGYVALGAGGLAAKPS